MQATEERGSAVSRLDAACALLRSGQVTEAGRKLTALAAHTEVAATEAEAGGDAVLLAALVECRLARGDLTGIPALRRQLAPLADVDGVPGAVATYATAEIVAVTADPEDAIPLYLAAGRRAAGHDLHPDVAPWRVGAVLAMVRSRHRNAAALAAEHHEDAVRSGSAYAVALALRTLAVADAHGRRLPLLREARAALDDTVAERLAAQIDADIAGLLALSHDPLDAIEAVELLRGAEAYAAREQLWPLHGRVHRLLQRLGEDPRPMQDVGSLTESERVVAGLAIDGLTNRQIAERLLVSVKAVEWHLSRTYRKLGIGSRQALAATLRGAAT